MKSKKPDEVLISEVQAFVTEFFCLPEPISITKNIATKEFQLYEAHGEEVGFFLPDFQKRFGVEMPGAKFQSTKTGIWRVLDRIAEYFKLLVWGGGVTYDYVTVELLAEVVAEGKVTTELAIKLRISHDT